MAAKRILIISASEVVPTISGGTVRTAGVARALARMGYAVHIYCLAARRESYGQGGGHRCDEIEPGLTQQVHLGWLFGVLQALFRRLGMPRLWQFGLMRAGWVPRALKVQVAAADVVICDMPHTPPLPGRRAGQPWILMSHDLTWCQLALGPWHVRLWTGWMRRVEAAAPRRYDDIIAVTEEDRDFFRAHDPSGRLALPIVGSGVDPERYRVAEGVRERTRVALGVAEHERVLLFAGSRFGPNVEALAHIRAYCERHARWLEEVGIRVLIVGSIEPEAYRRGALIATGRVASIADYFAAADAGFNPVVSGSGANVKLFEYLAARLPVISTEFGVRGSALQPGDDYIRCEVEDFTPAFEAWLARSREDWAAHAERVWQRHRADCDIGELTRRAVARLPGFS